MIAAKQRLQCRKNRITRLQCPKKRKREAEEGGDALKSLENTTLGSKIEIAALDEMKSMESQHAIVSADATLEDSPTKVAKRYSGKHLIASMMKGLALHLVKWKGKCQGTTSKSPATSELTFYRILMSALSWVETPLVIT
ncbi:uncharacterized protein LOC126722144 [Quercus robur]|uniref:uncharacterized protein LOC126722144 n=1 Tax=Quercus robur TaxID=38942 RepID=UPI002161EA7E|nr:uncharacterized protein LOC126722144 [Quercus robur]